MALAAVPQPDLAATYEMPVEQVSLFRDAWNRIRRNRLALVGAGIIVLLVLTAILATFWTPYPVWLQAVGPTYQPPSAKHLLGLDQAGRDILSRIMGGASITVQVGVGSAIIVSLIGIPLGPPHPAQRARTDHRSGNVRHPRGGAVRGVPELPRPWASFTHALVGRHGRRRLPRHGLCAAHRAGADDRAFHHADGVQLAGRRLARRLRPTHEALDTWPLCCEFKTFGSSSSARLRR